MIAFLRTCMLLALFPASSKRSTFVTAETADEDCGDVQHNVDNGIIRLPDFLGDDVKNINCSWTYVAPPNRKLLVKVDSVHLPPSDIRSSAFQLYIDDQLYDIPRNCVKCLKEMVGGKTIRVLFSSIVIHNEDMSQFSPLATESIGLFQVRYKSFDPYRCSKPEQVENGYVVSKGRKIGQSIFYRCNPPYDIFGESEIQCQISEESPVPDWSNKPPKCGLQDCTNGPIIRDSSTGAIASPGFPTYVHQFTSPCQWIINAQLNQRIIASVTYLKVPKHLTSSMGDMTSLSLIDGDYLNVLNITESLTNVPLNFTTLSNQLTIHFKVIKEDNKRKEQIGFYLEYSFVSGSCPKPKAPANGEVIAYSSNFGSVAAFKCDKKFVLVGELHAECLLNGQWSHQSPTCEALRVDSPFFVAASNDSDTVTAKLSEFSSANEKVDAIPSKPSRNKKKELIATSYPVSSTSTTQMSTDETTYEKPSVGLIDRRLEAKNDKKSDKENGPKSEPHLFQLIPPKNNVEKGQDSPRPSKGGNANRSEEQIPFPNLDPNQTGRRTPFWTMTMIAIIAGVGAPMLVAIVILVAILVYRRRYPVRMRFGRKFSTFENPMYVSKDAQHPRELKRLTP